MDVDDVEVDVVVVVDRSNSVDVDEVSEVQSFMLHPSSIRSTIMIFQNIITIIPLVSLLNIDYQ